jgi:two-component system response regulator AtoC
MSVTILIVDDEDPFRENMLTAMTSRGFETAGAANLEEARQCIQQGKADVIVLDVMLPDGYGPHLLEEAENMPIRPPIILITGKGDIDMAVKAMKDGAMDFIQKPVNIDQLEETVAHAVEIVEMRRQLDQLRQSHRAKFDFIVERAQRIADASATALITGETGTGKDVLAEAIHMMGPRANKPFIPINSGAIVRDLMESELFGHEVGAYTDATKRKHGQMEIADNGILFLDEISTLPIDMQPKLLRALEERAFYRVGGVNLIHVDVQILAATNRNLEAMVKDGSFRSDLYYRLKGAELKLPPLRDRKQDIPQLVALFITKNNQHQGKNILDVTPRAMEALMNYSWPGNIRELRQAIDAAFLYCDDASIDLRHLPTDVVKPKDYPK